MPVVKVEYLSVSGRRRAEVVKVSGQWTALRWTLRDDGTWRKSDPVVCAKMPYAQAHAREWCDV
jgi:hypothetical protein